MLMSFCINCGKIVRNRKELHENLCMDCYVQSHPLVNFKKSKHPILFLCPDCLSFKLFKKWNDPTSENMSTDIMEELNNNLDSFLTHPNSLYVIISSLNPDPFDLSYVKAHKNITITVMIRGKVFPETSPISSITELVLKTEFQVCTRCKNIRANQHAAEITILKKGKSLTKEEINSYSSFLSKMFEKHATHGMGDYVLTPKAKKNKLIFQIGSVKLAKKLASSFRSKFGALVRESYKHEDQEKSRETRKKISILIRLLPFEIGDVLLYENTPLLILKIFEKQVECLDFFKNTSKKFPTNSLFKAKLLYSHDDLEEFSIISQYQDVLQIMDAQFQIYDLTPPTLFKIPSNNSKIKGFFFKDAIYILPPEKLSEENEFKRSI